MDLNINDILWYLFIGGIFFMMMRRGGCCGSHRQKEKVVEKNSQELNKR